MSVEDLRNRIRPELARASPYRWQEGIPDGPVDRFDMNTPADPPAWYAEAIARLAAIPPNDYPDASYLPLKRAIAGYAGVDARPGRRRRGLRRGARAVRAARARPRRSSRSWPSRPTSSTPSRAATRAPRCSRSIPGAGLALAREGLVREARRRARRLALQPEQPDRRAARRRARRAHLRGLPGHRRARPGLPRARRRRPLGARRRAREPRRHAHVLEGLRARRGARRLRPRAAGAGRGARRPAPARLDLVLVGGRRRAGLQRDRGAAGALRRDRRGARLAGRGHARARASRCSRSAGNFVLARSPVPDVFTRLVERGCAVRTFTHEPLLADCFRVTVSHRPPTSGCCARSPSSRAARPRRPTTACAATASARCGARRARRASRCASACWAAGARASRRASASSTTCSRASRSGRSPTSSCAAHGDLWVDEHHTVEDCAIALGEALDIALGDRAGRAPLRLGARAARRGARRGDGRPLGPRHRRARPRARRAARSGACRRSLVPHFFDSFARRGRLGLHVTRERRGRAPRHRGRLQGGRAGAARGGRARRRPQRHREHEGRPVIATLADYGAGNLRSLRAAFERAGADVAVDRPTRARSRAPSSWSSPASARPPPRWRRCASAASSTRSWRALRGGAHLFGVCVGMQLLFSRSEEGDTAGLGLLPGSATRLDGRAPPPAHGLERRRARQRRTRSRPRSPRRATSRTPTPSRTRRRALRAGLDRRSSTAPFASLVGEGRVAGAQFHPERSGAAGAEFLRAVLRWAGDAA